MTQNSPERVVVKYGSDSSTNETGMDVARLNQYAEQIEELTRQKQFEVVIVASGSIAVGQALWNARNGRDEPSDLQSLASIGAGVAFTDWQKVLRTKGILAGMVPVTHHDIDVAEQQPAESNKLNKLLESNLDLGIISVVNENDALSDEEIIKWKYGGDNDGLARHVAQLIKASHLCLMTGKDGVLDEKGQTVPTVNGQNIDYAYSLVYEPHEGSRGRGGMHSKITAAREAQTSGIESHIALAGASLVDVVNRRAGTHFPAE